jgi:diguanylate cyclase (GGDEF)-like protein/PAS domain S-box-containing protein
MAADNAAISRGLSGVVGSVASLTGLASQARPRRGSAHVPAALLAAAAAAWIAATLGWLGSGAGAPGVAPALGWAAAGLAAGFAMGPFPGSPRHVSGQLRSLVDGFIVAVSTLCVGWSLGLDDLSSGGTSEVLALLVALLQIAVAASAVVTLTRAGPSARARIAPIARDLGGLALAAPALAYLALAGTEAAAVLLCAGWPLGWWAVALAAGRRSDPATDEGVEKEEEPGLPTRESVFVPSVPFAVAVLAAAAAGTRGEFEGFLIVICATLFVLIVIRQMLALWENISFWRRLEAKVDARTDELRRSEARFRSLVQHSSDMITVLDASARVEYQSPSAMAVLGYSPQEMEELNPPDLVHEQDRAQVSAAARELAERPGGAVAVEVRVRHRDGGWRHLEAIVTNLLDDPAVGGFVVNARDITERKELERQLTFRAFHDPLTTLANRALFGDRLGHALQRRHSNGTSVAVLFCDLDEFKTVNDSLGHGAGDRLLGVVASRLAGVIPQGDTVARLGGDEFAVLLEEAKGPMDAVRVAEEVLESLERPIELDGRQMFLRASIGIAMSHDAGESAEDLLRAADVAMYSAKASGKGGYEFFEASMHEAVSERLELESDLRLVLERDELVLDYQPIVSLEDGSLTGVEALVRWEHPRRGRLAPERFIKLAEATGQMVAIGGWVLRTACAQARTWRRLFPDRHPLNIVVNFSGAQLQGPGLVEEVEEALSGAQLDPGSLIVEVTESVALDSEHAVERLRKLHAMGTYISIDDFGTGYSSLDYLRRLPIDVLKIDATFLGELGRESDDSTLVDAILAMSHSLGIIPVAEGVERETQADELTRLGCRLAQGFLFHRPCNPEHISKLLSGERRRSRPFEGTPVTTGPLAS